jgi:hypothetical protein
MRHSESCGFGLIASEAVGRWCDVMASRVSVQCARKLARAGKRLVATGLMGRRMGRGEAWRWL